MTFEELVEIKNSQKQKNSLRFCEKVELKPMQKSEIMVCVGGGCASCGGEKVIEALKSEIKHKKLENLVKVSPHGCFGLCAKGPLVVVYPSGILYSMVKPEDAKRIIEEHVVKGKILKDKLCINDDGSVAYTENELNFFKNQKPVARESVRYISMGSIEDYISVGGYFGIAKCLRELNQDDVIKIVTDSKLRGRGGAGFSTGKKWLFAKVEKNEQKYVICNADEGDPGAFMDGSTLESTPHSVLEGMMIAGFAIGANKGVIYVRAEYKRAGEMLVKAIKDAKNCGLLGKNIFGSNFDFDIEISYGAGAFVCGEETALIASVEGKRGEPQTKPPYPAVSGLFGCPTIINNVETLSNIPQIIVNGPNWFNSIGTENSGGTKIFALSGKIKNTGLVEVPMGTTLRKIIFDIGGGVPNGKRFKAVQIGGPSGGCIPEEYLDTPVDYETLSALGSMMGSGGMIVVDEDTCMVDFAKFFLEFTCDESCGKCTPCRIGNKRLLEILTRICDGKGKLSDLEELEKLAKHIKSTSLCGLGQSSPNPVLSTLKYFKDEYIAHIVEHRCPAKVCKALTGYIVTDKCVGCGICKSNCPAKCIDGELRKQHKIDKSKCLKCGLCATKCPMKAIIKN